MRLILMGNSGAGKSTLAERISKARGIPWTSLDRVAWSQPAVRKPLEDSKQELDRFVGENRAWIIEGCYSDLIEHLLPRCDEIWFLNPGRAACLEHCIARPWEPDKFSSPEEQDAMLLYLLEWVKQFEARDDEFGLARHRRIFDGFGGLKRELTQVSDYDTVPELT